jgi:hypothetical protein
MGMRGKLAIAALLALLVAGCVTQTAPQEPAAPAPQPAAQPACGDGACNGAETNATCCADCGCAAGYSCTANSSSCLPGAERLQGFAVTSFGKMGEYTMKSDMSLTTTVRGKGSETTETNTSKVLSEINTPKQEAHESVEAGGIKADLYYLGNTTYMQLPDVGWVKDDTTYWEGMEKFHGVEKKLISQAKASYLGNGTVGGKPCHWVSLEVSEAAFDDLKRMIDEITGQDLQRLNYSIRVGEYSVCVSDEREEMLSERIHIGLNKTDGGAEKIITVSASYEYYYGEGFVYVPAAATSAIQIPTPYKIQREYCKKIDPTEPSVRSAAVNAIRTGDEGPLNTYQVIDMYEFVKSNIRYVSDPSRVELATYPYAPEEVLKDKAGDCDDQATLLASLVEAIGGTSRVVVNFDCSHAYTEVLVADSDAMMQGIVNDVLRRYPDKKGLAVHYYSENDGTKWLVLDPAGADYPGELHPACYSTNADNSWTERGSPYKVYSCK